jgi:tRNA pseudouridine65 synthase
MIFRILHQHERFVAVDKPAGIHVHPPEDERFRIPKRENGLAILRDQLGRHVYPVHRLDRATSGVLLYALDSEAAALLSGLFVRREPEKTYYALVRGHAGDESVIESPLAEEGKEAVDARTRFRTIARATLPWPNGRYETSRYSLLRVEPETGRFHQIRKHLRRAGHPIVGDAVHGDGDHNRLWREELGRRMLFLKTYSLAFRSPFDGARVELASYRSPEWIRAFDLLGACPHERIRTPPRKS